RDHGRVNGAGESMLIGHNAKMDEIQAAVLLTRLGCLEQDVARRAELAAFYDRRLAGLAPLVRTPAFPVRPYPVNQVFYVYLIEVEGRDALVAHLNQSGIGTEVYYPIPIHFQPAFASHGHCAGDFPNAARASSPSVALPLSPDLGLDQAEEVCRAIETFYATR